MVRGRGRAVREKRPRSGTPERSRARARARPVQDLPVFGGYITLGQLLKRVGAIQTGGGARPYLNETNVRVNGEPEERRGRKLVPGDRVELPDRTLRLVGPGGPQPLEESGEQAETDAEKPLETS